MNKVELLGRLTRNPEMKNVGGSGDTPMARYKLMVTGTINWVYWGVFLWPVCKNNGK